MRGRAYKQNKESMQLFKLYYILMNDFCVRINNLKILFTENVGSENNKYGRLV